MTPERTLERERTTATRRRPSLEINDPVLAHALHHLLDQQEQPVCARRLVLGDDVTREPIDVLVVPPTPIACNDALARVGSGATSAVITTDALEHVHAALQAASQDIVFLPRGVVTLARRLPPLSERDIRILRGLMVGYSNGHLARLVGISEATLKRAIATLMTRMGVTERSGLVVAGIELGLKPNGIGPARQAVAT
jgi:DNA-binding CsgD family transcriptional regulator